MKKIIILICFCFFAKVNGQTVTTFAGSTQGFLDGTGTAAKFYSPLGLTTDSSGNVYVADSFNNRIRKITPSGVVSTFAGSVFGSDNGTLLGGPLGYAAATFALPSNIVIATDGTIYVSDQGNHRIRKITVTGTVTTLAGSSAGFINGTGTAAQFNNPTGLAIDINNNIYVADAENHKIRKITPSGLVSTFAGSTQGFLDGSGTSAKFNNPNGLIFDNSGNLIVTDALNHRIRKITSSGVVTTLAGSSQGFADGIASSSQFNTPAGITKDTNGNLYIADYSNHKIRKISPTGIVSTIAGSTQGNLDGYGAMAQFNNPIGISIDLNGIIYVSDYGNSKIRKITITPSLYTYVPDDNFEQELINQGYDSVIDDYVLTANISSLTSLNVSSKSIADLTGIQDFVGLQSLICSYNNLTNLTLSNFPVLENLDCSHNQLTNLSLTNLPLFHDLNCYSNQLTVLNVDGLQALQSLECGANQLTSLSISNLLILGSLSCGENQLTSLNLTNLPSLSTLYAISNQLVTVNLSSLNSLSGLNLSNNQLTTLNVNNLTNLSSLECDYNYITTLNVTNNVNLIALGCRNNDLTSLDITTLPSLSYLNFGFNHLTSLDTSNSSSLVYLYCYFNQLTSLNLSNSPNLTELWCMNNNITSLNVTGLSNLYNLWCYTNQLTSLNVSSLTNLVFLKSYGNPLTTLNVGSLPSLQELWTNYTQISTLDVSLCPSLYLLYTDLSPNLTCIRVADVVAANANPNFIKDAIATYTDTPCVLGLNGFTSSNNLEIYPNPNNGKFSINSNNEKVTQVSLFSLDGKLINTQKPNTLNPEIALPEISKGMYLLNIILESGSVSKSKIIIE